MRLISINEIPVDITTFTIVDVFEKSLLFKLLSLHLTCNNVPSPGEHVKTVSIPISAHASPEITGCAVTPAKINGSFRPFSKPRLWLWIRLRLDWPLGCFDNCACFAYAPRASDDRMEPEAESKAAAVVSKRG